MTDENFQEFVDYLKQNETAIKGFLTKQRKLSNCDYLNKPSNRFDKGKFAEIPLCSILSELKYEETDGYDAIFKSLKVSIKSEKKFFLEKKGTTKSGRANLKGDLKPVILKNSNSSKTQTNIALPDFDILLVISSFQESLAVIKRSNVQFVPKGSQVKSDYISKDKVVSIVEPKFGLKQNDQNGLSKQIKNSKEQWVLDIYSKI